MCSEVTEEVRMEIFNEFWQLRTWDEKRIFATTFIEKRKTLRRRNEENESRKDAAFDYNLRSASGKTVRVCKQLFLSTFAVGEKQLRTWLKRDNPEEPNAQRSSSTKINDPRSAKTSSAREFISNLPTVPSHYCRSSTSEKYVDASYKSFLNLHVVYSQ